MGWLTGCMGEMAGTYNDPVPNTAKIPTFRFIVICRCQMEYEGMTSIPTSETTLKAAEAVYKALGFRQCPGSEGVQIFLRGMHRKMGMIR